MYHDIIDMVECFDSIQPCLSYRNMSQKWFADASQEIDTHMKEIECVPESVDEYISFVEDLFHMFIEMASSRASLGTTTNRLDHVHMVLQRPQMPQRTPDWYAQSRNVLTASEFSEILGTDRAVNSIVSKKLEPVKEMGRQRLACLSCEMSAMDWGVRFEPVVKQILEARGTRVLDVGRIIHADDPRLAASPDGIIMESKTEDEVGCLLEIKCPVRREIGGKIPFEYWCQMQIQMEVTGISKCEYLEMKFVSPYRGDTAPYKAPEDPEKIRGEIWLLQNMTTLEMVYAYTEVAAAEAMAEGLELVETIPWHLDSSFQASVIRDTNWFNNTLTKRNEFWKRVEEARNGSYVIPQKAPKGPVVKVCKIVDDS